MAGAIPADPAVGEAVRMRLPFTLAFPDAAATTAVREAARRLVGLEPEAERELNGAGFLSRLARRLGIGVPNS